MNTINNTPAEQTADTFYNWLMGKIDHYESLDMRYAHDEITCKVLQQVKEQYLQEKE